MSDIAAAYNRGEINLDAVADRLMTHGSVMSTIAQYYKQNTKSKPIFQELLNEFVTTETIEAVLPVTVLCREPDGELGELYLYEVAPKSLKLDEVEHEWNNAVSWFMWTMTAKQAYGLFLLSHAPESRVPPSDRRIASMTPAQIDAKNRAVRFLLTSVFSNEPERLAKLHKHMGGSPWKTMVVRTQTFGLQYHTVGYVIATITLDDPPALTSIERTIVGVNDITLPALARAAMFYNNKEEVILAIHGVKNKVVLYTSVFVVSKTLFTIDDNGDLFYNAPPGFTK